MDNRLETKNFLSKRGARQGASTPKTSAPLSIQRLLEERNELAIKHDGLPHVGSRPDSQEFYTEVKKVKEAFDLYGFSENLMSRDLPSPPQEKVRLGAGSPAAFPAFPTAKKKIIEALESDKIHEYPLAAGNDTAREEFVKYLASIGFKNDTPYADSQTVESGLSKENVIFTSASTQAFDLILKVIARKDDIVLMTAPNYGLFSFMPERMGARVELVALKEENDWLLDPKDLAQRIDYLNHKYAQLHKNKKNRAPRVVAFFNMNPHNPLGKVMGKSRLKLLTEISQVCKQRGVFVIDDLVYRDLTFDRNELSVPVSSIKGMFQNTISLFSLSKAYSLASIRAGAIVADETVIRGIRNSIFQTLDSVSTLQVAAIAGAFNTSTERQKTYDKYFSKLIPEYQYRYQLIKALVEGLTSVQDKNLQKRIIQDVEKYAGKSAAPKLLQGIKGVCLAAKTTPEAGFFALLDFSALKNKYYYGLQIKQEKDLMKFLFNDNNIKFISGESISWPDNQQFIGRVTFALVPEDLVLAFSKIKESVEKLKDYKQPYKPVLKGENSGI